jgi:hypothetical protein
MDAAIRALLDQRKVTVNDLFVAIRECMMDAQAESVERSKGEKALTLPEAKREDFSMAADQLRLGLVRLNEANTYYNSARYHQMGTWKRADPDRP